MDRTLWEVSVPRAVGLLRRLSAKEHKQLIVNMLKLYAMCLAVILSGFKMVYVMHMKGRQVCRYMKTYVCRCIHKQYMSVRKCSSEEGRH